MTFPVDILLPIITVLANLRSQVTNWFRSRAVSRPAQDLTLGTPVEFDDLTSESNKQEVRQHDYYDRRKETLNTKERKYAVATDDPDNVTNDQYTNEALETVFSQAVEVRNGLESLFAKTNESDASSNDPKGASHDQKSSKDEPKDTSGDDSKNDNENHTVAEPADKLMLPREAEARELFKLYEMPPKPSENNDQISVSSTDSLDSQVRLPWRQWINCLRSKTFSFGHGLRNTFRRQAKTSNKKPRAGKVAGGTGSEEPKDGSAEKKTEGNTLKMIKLKNPLRKMVTKYKRQQKLSVEQTNVTNKDDDTNNSLLTENNQEKIQTQPLITPASMYGPSTMALPKCAWGHDDCDYIQQKMKLLGYLPSRDHGQPSHPVEPVQRITKPRSHRTNGLVPTTKKTKKGKRLAWFTSRSKKASQKSGMTMNKNRPVERRDVQVTGSCNIVSGSRE